SGRVVRGPGRDLRGRASRLPRRPRPRARRRWFGAGKPRDGHHTEGVAGAGDVAAVAKRAAELRALIEHHNIRYHQQDDPEIAGVAISLLYEDGRFTRAATRGNGVVGEDVTENIRTIAVVPDRLKRPKSSKAKVPSVLEVRGEVYMPLSAFEALNRQQGEAG